MTFIGLDCSEHNFASLWLITRKGQSHVIRSFTEQLTTVSLPFYSLVHCGLQLHTTAVFLKCNWAWVKLVKMVVV